MNLDSDGRGWTGDPDGDARGVSNQLPTLDSVNRV